MRMTAAIAAALIAIVAWSTYSRYMFLASSPFPMGVDGYFYPIQLRALLEEGALRYPASPLAFWIMAPLAALTDPITGAKLGAALGGALAALPAYAVGARLGASRAAGLVAATVAVTSAGSWYLTIEFVKNGWGVTAALTAVWLILRAIEQGPALPGRAATPEASPGAIERRSAARIALAAVGFAAALLTHKMAGALVALVALPAIAVAIPWTRRRALVAGGALAGVGVVAAVLALVAPERFLAARDLGGLADLFSTTARWGAPALAIDRVRFELPLGHEALLAGLVALAGVALLITSPLERRSRPATAAAIAVLALALFVALPWLDVGDPQGLGFRLRIVAFVPLSLACAIVVGHVGALVAPRLAELPAPQRTIAPLVAGALVAAAPLVLAPAERGDGAVRAHPAMVAAVTALDGAIPEGDVAVVSERHILFMAAWYTRSRATLRPEPVPPARRWRLMPLAFIGRDNALYRLLMSARDTPGVAPPRGFHARDPNGLVLVPEATWEWILERLPPTPRRHYAEWHTI